VVQGKSPASESPNDLRTLRPPRRPRGRRCSAERGFEPLEVTGSLSAVLWLQAARAVDARPLGRDLHAARARARPADARRSRRGEHLAL